MPYQLLSQVYSTNTLVEEFDIAKREAGLDPFNSTEAALTQVQKLKEMVCFQHGLFPPDKKGVGSTNLIDWIRLD